MQSVLNIHRNPPAATARPAARSFIDRYGMTIAFAGLLGLAAATRVSDRAGQWLTFAVLVCGAWSI